MRTLSVSIASTQQNIKMKFIIINYFDIPYWLWGLSCLRINSFAYVFLVYLTADLLFCTYSLISNRRKKAHLIMSSYENLKPGIHDHFLSFFKRHFIFKLNDINLHDHLLSFFKWNLSFLNFNESYINAQINPTDFI